MKKFLRGLAITLLVGGLYISLFNLFVFFPVAHYATDKEAVKSWLVEAGVYEAVPGLVSAQLIELEIENVEQSELVDEAIKDSITPEFVQTSIESVINGTYDFLNEETQTIEFSIEVGGVFTSLQKNFTEIALERIEGLPVCTSDAQAAAQTDPLEAECRPAGLDTEEFKKRAKQELEGDNSNKIPDTLTAQYLLEQSQESNGGGEGAPAESSGLTQTDLENIRSAYKVVKVLPYWFLGGVIVFAGLLYLVYRQWPKWLSRVAGVMISAGVVAILSTLVWHLGSSAIAKQAAIRTAGASQVGFETIEKLVAAFASDIATLTYILAGVSLVAGIGLKIYLSIKQQRLEKSKDDHQSSSSTPTSPEPPRQP